MSLKVEKWHWYSIDQALAAASFSRQAAELERQASGSTGESALEDSSKLQQDYRSYAIASLLASVAFMEASINELYAASKYPNLEGDGTSPEKMRRLLIEAEDDLRRNSILERYQLTLYILGKASFDKGAQPYQDAQLLIKLRNELVHYKPRWREAGAHGAGITESKVTISLAQRGFSLNPFSGEGDPFLPDRCLGHGCAAWAWIASLGLVDEFHVRLGIVPVYGNVRKQLSPEINT